MPDLYSSYVQPALSGLRQAAGSVGQALGVSAPDPNAIDGLKRAAQQARLQHAYETVSREMPEVQPVSVGLGGGRGPLRLADTHNYTGNITFNQDNIDQLSDPQLQEVMAHELTHSGQVQHTPFLKRVYNTVFGPDDEEVPQQAKGGSLDRSYYWRPNELEAFQVQRERMAKSGRSLQTDPMSGHYDIYLPPEKR